MDGRVFQEIDGIPIGTHCAPLLVDLFLYSYVAGSSCSLWYGSLIYNYLCNQYISPLTSWVRGVLDKPLCDKVCMWLMTGWWLSPSTAVSSINTIDWHIVENGVKHNNTNNIHTRQTSYRGFSRKAKEASHIF